MQRGSRQTVKINTARKVGKRLPATSKEIKGGADGKKLECVSVGLNARSQTSAQQKPFRYVTLVYLDFRQAITELLPAICTVTVTTDQSLAVSVNWEQSLT